MRATLTTLGRYRILGLLGEGGMGLVYRCRHLDQEREQLQGGDVAIKLLHRHLAVNPTLRARFEQEARLLQELDHPNIVSVFELIEEAGSPALVMECIEGHTLASVVGRVSIRELRSILWQVGAALEQVHAAGIVHRDLKTANVMRTEQGRVVLLDFGIAKQGTGGATATGLGLGTIASMAPEQFKGASTVDARADVYAFALLIFELLAGGLPWSSDLTEFDVLTRKARGELLALAAFRPELPAHLSQVLRIGLAPEPKDRFASARALLSALDAAGLKALAEAERPDEQGAPTQLPAPKAPDLASAELEMPQPLEPQSADQSAEPPLDEVQAPDTSPPAEPPPPGPRRLRLWHIAAATLSLPLLLCAGLWGLSYQSRGPVLAEHKVQFVQVPPGSVALGVEEIPASITYSYLVSTTEVTQALYMAVMEKSACTHGCGPNMPAHGVAWMDALRFCNELSEREGLTPAYFLSGEEAWWDQRADGYRLPTEAEWERAAQADQGSAFAGGEDPSALAWFGEGVWKGDPKPPIPGNAKGRVHPVAQLTPNAWGLSDMSGNVVEWVWDWEAPLQPQAVDPVGPGSGTKKLAKGGSFQMASRYAMVGARASQAPDQPTPAFGFRLARGALP